MNDLDKLLESPKNSLNESIDQINRFNELNENLFRFPQLNEKNRLIKKIKDVLDELIKQKDHPQHICSCLNFLRILSRDKDQIEETFNNDELLLLV